MKSLAEVKESSGRKEGIFSFDTSSSLLFEGVHVTGMAI